VWGEPAAAAAAEGTAGMGRGSGIFPLPQQSRCFLIRGPAGLSWVFLVIHLLFGQAAPQQVGGLVNGPKHGAYETN
jgi:hypothetical protein